MPLYRRPDSPFWWLRLQVKGRRLHRSTGEKDRGRAEAVAERIRREARDRAAGLPARTTVDDALGLYWRAVEGRASARTIEYMLARWVALLGPGTALEAVSNALIAEACARLRGRSAAHGGALSAASVNRHLTVLRAGLRHAHLVHDAALPAINWRAHFQRESPPRDTWLTPEDARRLIA